MTNTAVGGVAAERDQFIPVRKADLLDALVEHELLGSEAELAKSRRALPSILPAQPAREIGLLRGHEMTGRRRNRPAQRGRLFHPGSHSVVNSSKSSLSGVAI
jgi:hypothetical protein